MIHAHTKMVLGISIALLLASLSTLGIFFYKLQIQKSAYESMRTADAEETARRVALTSLSATFDKTEDARTVIEHHILTESTVVDLLSLIETLGRENGVILSTDGLMVSPIDAHFEYLVATVRVEGRYASVLHMLELLEQLPYESWVENVDLVQEANSWSGVFEIRVLKFKSV